MLNKNNNNNDYYYYYLLLSDFTISEITTWTQFRNLLLLFIHLHHSCIYRPPHPFLDSFLLSSWRAVPSYRPHLEERNLIWGDDWSHGPFIRRSPSWRFLGFSSAVRQMPGDLWTAPRIISLSPLSIADGRDIRSKWPLAWNQGWIVATRR